ncbi:hypothetical protein [Halobacteriovorax sp. HLS]|uniref:Mbeg1-like protein n=1 Tax=Halobacteriovorax sp. HLS TaxID=2234000 RepID=UPI000FDC34EA|nr:hypothetical protein [Halobacteriovorax sp. HLS]
MSKILTILLIMLSISFQTYGARLDISKEYLLAKAKAQNQALDESLLLSFLKSQTIILVPGVLSESFREDSNQKIKVNLLMGEIFGDHENWLIENGLNYEVVLLESEASPNENADFLNEVIEEIQGDVILFTHSKGGIDTFAALNKKPELLKKVTGIITVQTPFYGSVIAENLSSNRLFNTLGKWLFNLLGGSEEGIKSLTMKQSKERMNANEQSYKFITSTVPVINFGSFKEDTFGWDTPLELFRDISEKKIGKNDGVVPLTSAFLEDAYKITEAGVDHLLSVTDCRGVKKISFAPTLRYSERWSYDRVAHFKALLESLRKVSY